MESNFILSLVPFVFDAALFANDFNFIVIPPRTTMSDGASKPLEFEVPLSTDTAET